MYLGMKFISDWNTGRVIKCTKCTNGTKPNGKKCKYCNGTGTVTKPNQS